MFDGFQTGLDFVARQSRCATAWSAAGHDRVDLYLYFPCGPYGLFRANMPVKGVHFTFLPVNGFP